MSSEPETPGAGPGDATDPRLAGLHTWLTEVLGSRAIRLEVASADASFRRYFRVHHGGGTAIAMDAPPEREPCEPFLRVARLLRVAGLHAPAVLAADAGRGYLLLEDLGGDTYLDVLLAGEARPEPLLDDAVDALVRWQAASRDGVLPPYDRALLERELDLFPTWYVGRHLGLTPGSDWQAAWRAGRAALVDAALAQPHVWVHRDYMPRNLLPADPNPGVIDFQDAVHGPITYDLASLLRDAFIEWSPQQEARWVRRYQAAAMAAGLPVPEPLAPALDLMAAQRHLKVLGIFARLCHRDGKPRYIAEAPRFLRYLDREFAPYPELADLREAVAALPSPEGRA
ncbi:aminoglycoside phosphotransferase family protein [Spiribacter halobius]|uniref:Aminoglycoside phosphotransferase n=1 Tax=Sediminicurvatus halobius TaxID=2182432 RepID=A0A2U2N834_9GAMM|nr:phosphotransferase [Spiribacter halobius]PWG65247.1 aminoglycoside phosphotransferase [Spiribacter halobius]UEX78797.1 phosphotransferase [Spiribacter halobius]